MAECLWGHSQTENVIKWYPFGLHRYIINLYNIWLENIWLEFLMFAHDIEMLQDTGTGSTETPQQTLFT